jgi:alpha-N-arabinofuranosidase
MSIQQLFRIPYFRWHCHCYMIKKFLLLLKGALFAGCLIAQAPKTLVVTANQKVARIQPTQWGVFFEDINFGADGGIYAELLKNRSFEFFRPLMGWTVEQQPFREGAVQVMNSNERNAANPRFLRVNVAHAVQGSLSLTNEGFRGIGVKQDHQYDFSFQYRLPATGITLHLELVNPANDIIGSASLVLPASGAAWSKQGIAIKATATEPKARFRIRFEGSGTIDMDMISLFPRDTWKNRPGGMRADMVQLLADLKPGFIRFPGGCIVEGFDLSQRYQWKRTIGPVEDRQLIINRWNFEFPHRAAPDYFQTFGLGFFEYFQLAEDIGAEPLPILNCGMACQFNSAELAGMDQLDPYIQDALDLIEFANGDTTTVWGKRRADMGHPAPFHLKMMGIGNENWGPQYIERLKVFQQAIKSRYPDFKLVTSSGTDPDGARFDSLNLALRSMKADFIDEHYYRKPNWFLQNARRYDNYPRNASKIFAGEYAAHVEGGGNGSSRNTWLAALSEAAFMTGLERNAAVVQMASYAPLFAHTDGWQWNPDLIWVDNLRAFGTPSYYVQQLYSLNRGSYVVPFTLDNDVVAGQDSLYAAAAIDTATNELILKIVNVSGKTQSLNLQLQGLRKWDPNATLILLQNDQLNAANSFDQPDLVAPRRSGFTVRKNVVAYTASAYSFSVIRIKQR